MLFISIVRYVHFSLPVVLTIVIVQCVSKKVYPLMFDNFGVWTDFQNAFTN